MRITRWHVWNWLGLTTTARTAHLLHRSMRQALTDAEFHELCVYNTKMRYPGGTYAYTEDDHTRMRALQDRYDASVREVMSRAKR